MGQSGHRKSLGEWDQLANQTASRDIQEAMLANLIRIRKNVSFITFVTALGFFIAVAFSVLSFISAY